MHSHSAVCNTRHGRIAAVLALLSVLVSPLWAARAMKPLEMKQRYYEVLGVLASGDLDRALAELTEFEQAAVGEQNSWRYVDNLWKAKLHVIRDLLANESPDLLRSIIVLHHDAYFSYGQMGRMYLAQHSRTMASELARVYAERAAAPAAQAFSGRILTSFGVYLWSPSNVGGSAELFFQAYLVDPSNSLAVRGLATAWERNGDYEKAIEYLEKALVIEPGDPELGLRLALCHLRHPEGHHEQAREKLKRLTTPSNPVWVRSVAIQELARARLAEGDRTGAESLLRLGLADLPGDQQISLQLASILDGEHRRSEALSVLDGIEIFGWERQSARQTYDFWEPPDPEAVRSEARQGLSEGYAALSRALAAEAEAES